VIHPTLLAFVVGLLDANALIVVISATGFVTGQRRRSLYVVIGLVTGSFSLVVGTIFLLGLELQLPNLL
jgi:hypothetical protein